MTTATVTKQIALLRRKHTTWRALPRLEKAWFLPIWLLLGISRIAIVMLPFHHLAGHLGYDIGIRRPELRCHASDNERARRLGRLIRTTARYTPWQSNCLVQALVAACLLRLYGIAHAVHFGVTRKADGSLIAHAWVDTDTTRVTGGRSSGFTVVRTFCHPAPARRQPRPPIDGS